MHPRPSSTTHTEQLGDEASVYDWARAQVHALNPTAACVWRLLGQGVAATLLPAIYSVVAPTPVEAQSPGPGAPTLTSVAPNQGIRGTTVAVALTGTNFVAGATTVAVARGGVTVNSVVVGSAASLTATFVLDLAAAAGARTVTVTTAGGTSGGP